MSLPETFDTLVKNACGGVRNTPVNEFHIVQALASSMTVRFTLLSSLLNDEVKEVFYNWYLERLKTIYDTIIGEENRRRGLPYHLQADPPELMVLAQIKVILDSTPDLAERVPGIPVAQR